MKKLCIAIALAGALSAPTLQAAMQVNVYQDTGQYSSGSGGEFEAVPNADLSWVMANYSPLAKGGPGNGAGFQTFCIETSEQFNPGALYNVALSDRAKYNGVPVTGFDVISVGTAFLYSQFASGTLSGYNYTYGAGRTAKAAELQNAIWNLEGEGGSISAAIATILQGEFGATSTIADWDDDATGWAYGVRAMNLTSASDNTIQDMLVVVPEPTTMIAGALLLLPFGASTIRFLRKNRTA